MGHCGYCEGDIRHKGVVGVVSLHKLLVNSSPLVHCPAMNPKVTGSSRSQSNEALWPGEQQLTCCTCKCQKLKHVFIYYSLFSRGHIIFIFWYLLFDQPELFPFYCRSENLWPIVRFPNKESIQLSNPIHLEPCL